MKVRAHKLKQTRFDNWFTEVEDRWNYDDFLRHRAWREDWISFDCLFYDRDSGMLFAGVTTFTETAIFQGFDTEGERFFSTGYEQIADRFDAKFHRSLERYDGDGCLYGAVALLHDIDRYHEAPGGAIVRYDPATGEIVKVAVPLPHVYIQSTVIDSARGMLYGQTFTPEKLFSYDLHTGEVRDLGPLGSGMQMAQGENIVLDERGRVWGSWGVSRAWQDHPGPDSFRLFCFDPEVGRIRYLRTGLPRADGSFGFEKPEAFFNLGGGRLYASGGNGSLYRLETGLYAGRDGEALKVQYLGTPIGDRPSRLAALTVLVDGNAYGVTGRAGKTELLRLNPAGGEYELLGPVVDAEGERPFQIHHVVAAGPRTLYAAENDNPHRSGYLWEIELDHELNEPQGR